MLEIPFARAAITPGGIVLNHWTPGLLDGGPGGLLLSRRRRGVVLADLLADHDERELIVRFVPRDSASEVACDALAIWAALVGWKRMWMDDRLIDLGDLHPTVERAGTRCPTCGVRWQDERLEFWEFVRGDGRFPALCMACGGSLPEWSVVDIPSDLPAPSLDGSRSTDFNRRVR